MLIIFLAQAMIAAPFILVIFFAIAFAFSMIVFTVGNWTTRILGVVNGSKPNLYTLFAQISAVFAILFIVGFILYYNRLAEEQPWIN